MCWAASFGLWLNTTQLLLETGSLGDATVANVENATLAFYNQFLRAPGLILKGVLKVKQLL